MTLTVDPVRELDYSSDDIFVEIDPAREYAGRELLWQLTIRILVALSPPEAGWDRYRDTYSNIAEPGAWTARIAELARYVERHELVESEPGQHSHYAHREHIAGSVIEGTSVRALCGAYFVPCRDHESLPMCPECQHRYEKLPR